jgi:phage-related protein
MATRRQRRTPCLVDDALDEQIALEELDRKVTARLGERVDAIEVDVVRSGGGRFRYVPARKYQYRRMTLQGAGQHLCPLDTEPHSVVFDGGNRGSRDSGDLR